MMQDPGGEMLRRFAQIQFLAGSTGGRPVVLVPQAHMNVHAVADKVGVGLGRKNHPMPEAVRHSARHLTGDHCMVRSGQGLLRGNRHLELARPVFGEKTIRNGSGGAQGGDECLAETALPAKGAERIGVARAVIGAGIDEFLLERGDEVQAGCRLQLARGAAQEVARAAFPRGAVGGADVAEKECSTAEPSAKSTRTSAAGSGTIIRSPAVPKGVSQIGPAGDIIRLLPVQPMPFLSRPGNSRAGNPLPRTCPEMSQVATKTSSSRIIAGPLPRCGQWIVVVEHMRQLGDVDPVTGRETEDANLHVDSSPPRGDIG